MSDIIGNTFDFLLIFGYVLPAKIILEIYINLF